MGKKGLEVKIYCQDTQMSRERVDTHTRKVHMGRERSMEMTVIRWIIQEDASMD